LSLEAKIRKRREKKKEGNFIECANLEVVTICFSLFPPSFFLSLPGLEKAECWELAICSYLDFASYPPSKHFAMLWFNLKIGVGLVKVKRNESFCKSVLKLDI
jgi:hypothetical protein